MQSRKLFTFGTAGYHAEMPTYNFHIALSENEPFPPASQLQAIEAADLADCANKLAKMKLVGEPKQDFAFVRVVTKFGPSGEVAEWKYCRVQVRPLGADN